MKTIERASSTRATASLLLVLVILVMLTFAILKGDLVLFASVLMIGGFFVVMAYSPENLINSYMWITFFVSIYQFAAEGRQIFALNSIKDILLIFLWFHVFIRGVVRKGKGILGSWTWGAHNVLSLGFFAYAFFTIFRGGGLSVGLLGFRKTAEFFTVFWLAQAYFEKKETVQSFLNNLVAIALVTAVLGLVQKATGQYVDEKIVKLEEEAFRRISSTYGNPNTFADVLLSAMVILLNRYLSGFSVRPPPFPALAMIVLIIPFLFAYSISALLALVAEVALILLLNRATTMRKTILLVFVGVVFVNVMAVTPLYYGRITWLQRKLSDPTQREGRTKSWREVAGEIRQAPLFGVGYGKFGGILQPDSAFIIENIVDNSYFLLLIQYGIVGFGLFTGLLGTVFRQGWRVLRSARDKQIREMAAGLFVILLSYCIIAFALNVWEMMFPINFLFWLSAGILFRLPLMDDAEGGKEGPAAAAPLPRPAPRVSDFRSRISDLRKLARVACLRIPELLKLAPVACLRNPKLPIVSPRGSGPPRPAMPWAVP